MTDLNHILSQIESASEDARNSAWMTLYVSTDETYHMELIKVLTSDNDIRKIQLARFLGKIPETKAILYLVQLLFEDSANIISQSIRSFEQNDYADKHRHLLPLLKSTNKRAVLFAIEELAEKQITESIDPLIELLHSKDESIQIAILSGFRFLKDKRTLPHILNHCQNNIEHIQFHAFLALGALFQQSPRQCRKMLIKGAHSKSSRIRQTCIWTLHRNKSKGLRNLYIDLSTHDSDPNVRQECLVALTSNPSVKSIKHIIKQITIERSQPVILKAEAALLTMPYKVLGKSLRKILQDKDFVGYSRTMTLYAEFHRQDDNYLKFLKKEINRITDTHRKVPIIESMGHLENMNALPILESLLSEGGLIEYTAMTSITKVWNHELPFPVLKYTKNQSLSILSKQIALKYFVKHSSVKEYTPDVTHYLVQCLKSTNINIRYLSAQALAKSTQISIIEPFFKSYLVESDSASKQFFEENIIHFINTKPKSILSLIQNHQNSTNTHKSLIELLNKTFIEKEKLYSLISKSIQNPIQVLQNKFSEPFIHFIYQLLSENFIDIEQLCLSIPSPKDTIHLLELLSLHHTKEQVQFESILPAKLYQDLYTQQSQNLENIIALLDLDHRPWSFKFLIQCHLSKKDNLKTKAKELIQKVVRYD